MQAARQGDGLRTRLNYFLVELRDVLRGLTPERQRARYGDMDFDWDHRVDTTAANVSLLTRLRGVFAGSQYQPADPGLFTESMAALPIEFSSYTFIDAGSGKGRALLMACQYPFRRVVGIEVVPELHVIAQRNLVSLECQLQPSALRQCVTAESWLGDATEFPWPPEPTVVFLFNPFPPWILERFLQRLEVSLRNHPRKVWLVYHCPVGEQVLRGCEFLRKTAGTEQVAIYTNSLPEPP